MKLVFIHGWGLDASFWDGAAPLLKDYAQHRVDRGFFGNVVPWEEDPEPSILIGHSLGFMYGIQKKKDWCGWVAINSFPRFITSEKPGCTSPAELRDIKKRLDKDPQQTLADFHKYIQAKPPTLRPDIPKLRSALDELRDGDIESDLIQLNKPGVVLASRNDVLVPIATSESLAHNQTHHWHETGGHILPQSNPVWCADAIKDFLNRHDFTRD
ncbi:MAG: alpha/beta hydrolase [Alphaproteobacteria bacterium]